MPTEEEIARAAKDKILRTFFTLAGGILLGIPVGFAIHRFLTESPLPIESFDWILHNGTAGFALVCLFLLSGFCLAVLRQRDRERKERDAERADERKVRDADLDRYLANLAAKERERAALDERYAAKVEQLLRETQPGLQKVAKALNMIAGATPAEPTPLPPKKDVRS